MAKLDELVQQIEQLSVLEVSELVKALEEKFGVSAAMPVAAMPAAGGAGAAEVQEAKDAYNVVITAAGESKINLIKVVRTLNAELGLKEAKDLVEKAPATVAQNVKTEEAQKMKADLEAAGATVELQ